MKTMVMLLVLVCTIKGFAQNQNPHLIYAYKDIGQFRRTIVDVRNVPMKTVSLSDTSSLQLSYAKKYAWIWMKYYKKETLCFEALLYKEKDTMKVMMNKHYMHISDPEAKKVVLAWLKTIPPEKVYRRRRR